MSTRRQVSIFINGKQVENSLRGIQKAKSAINAELRDMTIGTAEYEAKVGDLRKLNGIFDEHRKKVGGVGQAVDGLTKGALNKLAGLAGAAFATDVIIGYGKELFKLGVEMEVLDAKAKTVFGSALPAVTSAAQMNATALGLTTTQYTNAAAAIGDLLIPMKFTRDEAASMSTQLVDLSGALSEWTGGQRSAEEVSQTLSKAILGEREELKSLGIAISEEDVKNRIREKGLQNLTGEYLQQAKAVATMELILEKSTDAQTAFANNSETLVRRQAELRAQLVQVSETLARTLQPVFERLVGVAASFAGGLESVADGFTSLINPAKSSSNAFDEQAAKVNKLESALPPLLDRYEELKGKSNLTKKEQTELAKVIQDIGILTPTAITEIDNYGKALGISASASREFLKAEKARLLVVNDQAITDNFRAAVRVKEQRDKLKKEIESGVKELRTVTLGGTTTQLIDLTAEEITRKSAELEKLTLQLTGRRAELKRLKGEPLTEQGTAAAPGPSTEETLNRVSGAPTDKEIKSAEKQRQKESDDLQKHLDELKGIAAKYNEDYFLQQLDADERELLQLELKYEKEIAKAKELEAKNVQGATTIREELEKQKYAAINALMAEQYAKEEETRKAEEAKQITAIGEKVTTELEARTAFNEQVQEFTLSEQEKQIADLQSHHELLLTEARKYGIDVTAIEEAFQKKLKQIREGAATTELIDLEKRKLLLEKNAAVYSSYASIASSALTLLTEANAEHTAAFKVVALAQIALNAAAAIASAVRAAAGEPFPANLVAIAASIAAVTGAIAQARAVFKKAPDVPQKYTGGFHNVTGAQDGRSYNAQYIGKQGTGLLPSHPVLLASERGPEYLVANEDLRNPTVLNHVRAIENIRSSRGGTVPQRADGGFTPTPAGGSSIPPEMLAIMANMMQTNAALLAAIEKGIPAIVGDNAIVDLGERQRQLNRASGGIL